MKEFDACVLEMSDEKDLTHRFFSKTGAGFILIAGQPINEPIARHGPFVMNHQDEIVQAFKDYQECKNGFEARANWSSKIRFMAQGKKYEEL